MKVEEFQKLIRQFYIEHGRQMPWRVSEADGNFAIYKILVSEIMLQQTQVDRVIPKFQTFITTFPTAERLAQAPLGQVLKIWSGLGYNRRAKYLHEAARAISIKTPRTTEELTLLKGIGHNTAAAVLTYSFNQRQVFIETNIRTVYFKHFFASHDRVSDAEVYEKVAATLPNEKYREFYWGLMDYGAHLKKNGLRNNTQAKQYRKQTTFRGSRRELRGKILRELAEHTRLTEQQLRAKIADKRLASVLRQLSREGLIHTVNTQISLP